VLGSLLAAELEVLAVTVEVAPVMPVMEVEGQVTCTGRKKSKAHCTVCLVKVKRRHGCVAHSTMVCSVRIHNQIPACVFCQQAGKAWSVAKHVDASVHYSIS
jgi:hypothetical protein